MRRILQNITCEFSERLLTGGRSTRQGACLVISPGIGILGDWEGNHPLRRSSESFRISQTPGHPQTFVLRRWKAATATLH